jgi:hypothetical protein
MIWTIGVFHAANYSCVEFTRQCRSGTFVSDLILRREMRITMIRLRLTDLLPAEKRQLELYR